MRTEFMSGKDAVKMARVTKPTARKAFNAGKEVRCAMIYDRVAGLSDTMKVIEDFDRFEASALYYNACKECGNYLKFYTELGGKNEAQVQS